MSSEVIELPGLKVHLDQLVYRYDPDQFSEETPHVFVYFLTIENETEHTIHLYGRKWILEYQDGSTKVIEGDGIVGKKPTIVPGGHFSYNSFHLSDQSALAMGSFFGRDENDRRIFTRTPPMDLHLPPEIPGDHPA